MLYMLTIYQFINNGLRCIAEILNEVSTASQPDSLADRVQRAGELLRVLAHVVEPLREETSLLPQLEPGVQDEFFTALTANFELLESLLSAYNMDSSEDDRPSQITRCAIFLARLLQFNLGFRGAWTEKTRVLSTNLSSTIFRLALVRRLIRFDISSF